MSRRTNLTLLTALLVLVAVPSVFGQTSQSIFRRAQRLSLVGLADGVSDREQDGLNGPVRRVRTETVKLANKNGKLVEGQRVTLEVAAYDVKGSKIENAYYPIPGSSITGKEVYKYDEKGNIIEMTLQDDKGTLLSKETYSYEFDSFGNWTKMTTAVAVIENGKVTIEPTEVTYRNISYYLDEATLAKMNQPQAPATGNNPAASPVPANNSTTNTVAANTNAPANTPSSSPNSKPAAQNNAPATNVPSSTNSNPSSQPVVASNKPAATSDVAKQDAAKQTAAPAQNNSSTPLVKASAPVSDKPASASKEQAANSADKNKEKPVETKVADEQASKPMIRPLLKPVSGGVLNGKAVNLPKPTYPQTAKSARMGGTVVVEVVIDGTGKVISARAVSGPALLMQAAVAAAYQAKFSPTILSGQPVKVVGTINYNFAIN